MKKIFYTAALMMGLMQVQAQVVYDYLKAADDYYRKGNYYSAAQYYEKYLTQEKKKFKGDGEFNPYVIQAAYKGNRQQVSNLQQALYNTAESYRQLHYYEKADPYYERVMAMNTGADFPLLSYHYGETKRALKDYAGAEKAYQQFLDGYKTQDLYSEAAHREIQNLRFIQSQLQKNIKKYSVYKAGKGLNDTGASYAPVWVGDQQLMFTSTRPDEKSKGKQYLNRVFVAGAADTATVDAVTAGIPQVADVNQGVVSLSADGNQLYLTRWTADKTGKKTVGIYRASKLNGAWQEPVLMDEQINVAGARNQQPHILPDGKHLLFTSDRSGGVGGLDIWMAELDSKGNTVSVSNAGAVINTKYDEEAPSYHPASKTLVFSSNGRVGMGGQDFFSATGTPGNWSEPVNMGYPVNSIKDDVYFTSRGPARNILEDVVISSDRDASCCLELFFLKKEKPMKLISGVITTCDGNTPLAGATVKVVDTLSNETVYTATTGADGKYRFELDDYRPLKVVAASDGFTGSNLKFNSPDDLEQDFLQNPELCLKPLVPIVTVLSNVLYDYNKANLRKESFMPLDSLVTLMNANPTWGVEIRSHTDSIGSDAFNQRLSDARAQSVVNYLTSKGIAADRLKAAGYGAGQPIAPNTNADGTDNPEGRQLNRRTEFVIIRN
jgi:outer membrane protein OmpA-like peptidoglycan-associated protein